MDGNTNDAGADSLKLVGAGLSPGRQLPCPGFCGGPALGAPVRLTPATV